MRTTLFQGRRTDMETDLTKCRRTFRCIIADDSAFARMNIAKVVSSLGGDVVAEAKDGGEAVDFYSRLNPDLVLMDITMPTLDGVDALRRIMAADKRAKVIMVSSIGHKEMVWKAICLGAKHFITKPFNPAYVALIVKSVIDGDEGGTSCATTT
jgi:two-component system chemotaxis response regulator CheY